jgi:phosphate-selective porin OprO and OprP
MKKYLLISIVTFIMLSNLNVVAQGCGDAPSEDGVQVFGFLQSQYEMLFDERTGGKFNPNHGFSFDRARIGVQGKIPYDFSYYVVVEYSPFISSNPYLLDAFVTYDRFKWAKVSMGSFKTPMGLEVNTACNGLISSTRSTASLQFVAPFRDMGLLITGGDKTTKLQYFVGIMNGSGLKRLDNNKNKDYVGRLLYRPIGFLQVGVNYRYGYPSYKDNKSSRTTFGGELKAEYKGVTLMGEYLSDKGDFNRDLGGGCGGELLVLGDKRDGAWAALAYKTKWNIEPMIKYDFFNSGNAQKYAESNISFGFNYYLNDWTRLQINYMLREETPVNLDNNRLVVQLQAKF